MVTDGIEFVDAHPKVVTEHLRSRNLDKIVICPENLKVVNGGRFLVLQVMNGKIKEYPVRRTFLHKLLKWHRFPPHHLKKLSADSAASICNDFLMNINQSKVIVKTENAEALSILSTNYNEITDLGIIRAVDELKVRNISRNDFFLSINSKDMLKTEPVPGDECGIGVNIVNSETGFRALKVSHFILRYVCTNGAIVKISGDDDNTRIHYGKDDLKIFVNKKVSQAIANRNVLAGKLKQLNKLKVSNLHVKYKLKLEVVLGKREAKTFSELFEEDISVYDLFNIITTRAKQYDLTKRYLLESFAGSLIEYR